MKPISKDFLPKPRPKQVIVQPQATLEAPNSKKKGASHAQKPTTTKEPRAFKTKKFGKGAPIEHQCLLGSSDQFVPDLNVSIMEEVSLKLASKH